MHKIVDAIFLLFKNNLDVVYFIYGFAFVSMGLAVWLQTRKGSIFKIADYLWLLCLFGLIHGISEWLDMWAIIRGVNPAFNIIRSFITIFSFFFLFEFGRTVFRLSSASSSFWRQKFSKLLFWWLAPAFGILIFTFSFLYPNFWVTANTYSRYILCFPATLLIAFGLVSYYLSERKVLESLRVKKYFYLSAFAFLIYGILSGLVVPKGTLLFSPWLNTDSFLLTVHFPPQVFRAICAIVIAWGVKGMLRIFEWETVERLEEEIIKRRQSEKELQESHLEIQRDYERQAILNKLLNLSLQPISMEEMLEQFIKQITSFSWLSLESKGSIFLVEEDANVLVMKVQNRLALPLLSICNRVPFGRCLCGRAALSRKIIFRNTIDGEHENRFEGMHEHGHYCIPVISTDRGVLGVINLYVKGGWSYDEKEEKFLASVANILAGIIERDKMVESVKRAYIKLQEIQDQLIQSEKINAVGMLASGVAHEVKNPLGVILQGINYLSRHAPPEKGLTDTIDMIAANIKRADKIINTLVDFSRATKIELVTQDLNAILEISLNLAESSVKPKNIEIIKEMAQNLPEVSVDKGKMEQVFVNLFLNAIQAMPCGGKIFVRSYQSDLKESGNGIGKREGDLFRIGERVVIVEIEDTGSGMSKEVLSRAFDPFFTTKEVGKGSGLGLSVTRNIIQMHSGLIKIESEEGKGTKVIITLKIPGGR